MNVEAVPLSGFVGNALVYFQITGSTWSATRFEVLVSANRA